MYLVSTKTYRDREAVARRLFKGCQKEFNEQTVPGNVINYFEEMLGAFDDLPASLGGNMDLEALFKAALDKKRTS